MDHSTITKAIIKSQHCQRNWDLTQEIPQADLDLILTAATQCPSKQNLAFYKLHVVTNREVIEKLYKSTSMVTSIHPNNEKNENPQTLANLVLVFEESFEIDDAERNDETVELAKGNTDPILLEIIHRDTNMAIGIAAGYVNLVSNMLGYSTGCCACIDYDTVIDMLDLKANPRLIMGIGFKDETRNRRIHHLDNSYVFPTKIKQKIEVNLIK